MGYTLMSLHVRTNVYACNVYPALAYASFNVCVECVCVCVQHESVVVKRQSERKVNRAH